MKRILVPSVLGVFGILAFSSYVFAYNYPCAPITDAETYYTQDGPRLAYRQLDADGKQRPDTIRLDTESVLITVNFDLKICIYHVYNTVIAQAVIFVPTLELKDAWEASIRDVQAAYQKYWKSRERQFINLVPVYRGRK